MPRSTEKCNVFHPCVGTTTSLLFFVFSNTLSSFCSSVCMLVSLAVKSSTSNHTDQPNNPNSPHHTSDPDGSLNHGKRKGELKRFSWRPFCDQPLCHGPGPPRRESRPALGRGSWQRRPWAEMRLATPTISFKMTSKVRSDVDIPWLIDQARATPAKSCKNGTSRIQAVGWLKV